MYEASQRDYFSPGGPAGQGGKMKQRDELSGGGQCIRYLLFVFNLFSFMAGCAIFGVGLWTLLDRNYMSIIMGNALFSAAAYIVCIAGGIIFVISFFGCCGAIMRNKCMLMTYFVFLILMFLSLIVGGILAIVFRTQLEIGEEVRHFMRENLQKNYGVNLDSHYNRAVTEAWDEAQSRLYCCAVEDQSWNTYRGSEWYKIQPGVPEVNKVYVPESCCVKDQRWNTRSAELCQLAHSGPPGKQSGVPNRYVYHRGCYEKGKEFVIEHSSILIGLGIGVGLMMVFGIICSICLYRQLDY